MESVSFSHVWISMRKSISPGKKPSKFPFTAFWIAQVKITQISDIEKTFTLFHDAFDICSRLDISFSDISNDQLFVPHLNGQLL